MEHYGSLRCLSSGAFTHTADRLPAPKFQRATRPGQRPPSREVRTKRKADGDEEATHTGLPSGGNGEWGRRMTARAAQWDEQRPESVADLQRAAPASRERWDATQLVAAAQCRVDAAFEQIKQQHPCCVAAGGTACLGSEKRRPVQVVEAPHAIGPITLPSAECCQCHQLLEPRPFSLGYVPSAPLLGGKWFCEPVISFFSYLNLRHGVAADGELGEAWGVLKRLQRGAGLNVACAGTCMCGGAPSQAAAGRTAILPAPAQLALDPPFSAFTGALIATATVQDPEALTVNGEEQLIAPDQLFEAAVEYNKVTAAASAPSSLGLSTGGDPWYYCPACAINDADGGGQQGEAGMLQLGMRTHLPQLGAGSARSEPTTSKSSY